jgi:hypothetical protein
MEPQAVGNLEYLYKGDHLLRIYSIILTICIPYLRIADGFLFVNIYTINFSIKTWLYVHSKNIPNK